MQKDRRINGVDRRALMRAGASALTIAAGHSLPARAAGPGPRAVAFDAFTIFDPRAPAAAVEEQFPGRGKEVFSLWRLRQFEYGWLRTLSGTYVDFRKVTEDALVYACNASKLDLDTARRARLMAAAFAFKPWPDAVAALASLRKSGVRLAYLSNLPADILASLGAAAGVSDLFEHQLSTDLVRAFKPDPRAYAMAESAFNLPKENIVFAAFGGWDAAGAKSFGLPTFWVNRLNQPVEELGVIPDAIGPDLAALAQFVAARRAG